MRFFLITLALIFFNSVANAADSVSGIAQVRYERAGRTMYFDQAIKISGLKGEFQTLDDFGNTLFWLDTRDPKMERKLKKILGTSIKKEDFINLIRHEPLPDRWKCVAPQTVALKKIKATYSDFKKVKGVKFPHSLTLATAKSKLEFHWKQITSP